MHMHLTQMEAKIVAVLASSPKFHTTSELCAIWDNRNVDSPEHTLRVYISRIRSKGYTIDVRWGFGYRLTATPSMELTAA